MSRVIRIIRYVFAAILIVSAYWNIWVFTGNVVALPARDSDDVVLQENRYREIRASLIRAGYQKGPVGFVTNRTLQSLRETGEDNKKWGQAQYAMVPWILVRNGSAVGHAAPGLDSPFVIGDFWDSEPHQIPDNFTKLFDSGMGVVLFRKLP